MNDKSHPIKTDKKNITSPFWSEYMLESQIFNSYN